MELHTEKTSVNLFVHSTMESKIEDNLTVVGKLQIIVYQSNCFDEFYEGWEFTVEPMEIDRVEFMGKLFSGSNTHEVIYFLEEKLNIKVWDSLIEDMEETIRCSGSVVEFVKEQTGVELPKVKVLADEI